MQLVYCEYQVFFDDGSINTRTSGVCIVVIKINNLLVFNGKTRSCINICKIIGAIYNKLFLWDDNRYYAIMVSFHNNGTGDKMLFYLQYTIIGFRNRNKNGTE